MRQADDLILLETAINLNVFLKYCNDGAYFCHIHLNSVNRMVYMEMRWFYLFKICIFTVAFICQTQVNILIQNKMEYNEGEKKTGQFFLIKDLLYLCE